MDTTGSPVKRNREEMEEEEQTTQSGLETNQNNGQIPPHTQ